MAENDPGVQPPSEEPTPRSGRPSRRKYPTGLRALWPFGFPPASSLRRFWERPPRPGWGWFFWAVVVALLLAAINGIVENISWAAFTGYVASWLLESADVPHWLILVVAFPVIVLTVVFGVALIGRAQLLEERRLEAESLRADWSLRIPAMPRAGDTTPP